MTKTLETQLIDGPKAQLLIDCAEIRICAGPDKGEKITLGTDSILIGSSSKCDIVLHDKSVSSRHAEIQSTTRGYFIRDLGSTNGILYGAQPLDRAPLCHGMRLSLGQSSILVHSLKKQLAIPLAKSGELAGLVAHSVKMRALLATLERVALSEATVLIEGETGSGKEMAAQAVHALSPRRSAPFVTFDCGALSSQLASAELFGHERGAFTGADAARPGLLEAANGGTLFIDEVGELPLDLQPLLLGAIERKRSRRIGGQSDVKHDVRIVAATNRNLAEEVRCKRFREDLFFRLAVARVRVPPLRERLEDIPALADQFAREAGFQLSKEALAPLVAYDWPGNIRELKNTVTRMVAQSQGANEALLDPTRLRSPKIFDEQGAVRPWLKARELVILEFERAYLQELLLQTRGNLTHAAELAGITRQSMTALAQKHGLHSRARSASDS